MGESVVVDLRLYGKLFLTGFLSTILEGMRWRAEIVTICFSSATLQHVEDGANMRDIISRDRIEARLGALQRHLVQKTEQ